MQPRKPLPRILQNLLALLRPRPKTIPARHDRAARGRFGEDAAARHLKDKGLRILLRNWRHGHGEIDLICQDGPALVFVEVRTRDAGAGVSPYHSVTAKKKRVLRRTCLAYVRSLRLKPAQFRFDIVEVNLGTDGEIRLTHHSHVSLFGKNCQP